MQPVNLNQQADDQPHPIWADAILAAQLIATQGAGLSGIEVKAGAGPVRDAWVNYLDTLLATSAKRITPDIPAQRLIGGIDLTATLASGKPCYQAGLLERNEPMLLAMAERCPSGTAAIIAGALDGAHSATLIALNEAATDDEGLPSALQDRLDMTIWLDGLSYRQALPPIGQIHLPTKSDIKAVTISDEMIEALTLATLRAGQTSMRKAISLMKAARAIAALQQMHEVTSEIAATAIRLVCARVVDLNELPEDQHQPADDETPPPPHEPPQNDNTAPDSGEDKNPDETVEFDPEQLLNMLIEAAAAERPDLAALSKPLIEKTRAASGAGKSGAMQQRARRGKVIGHSQKMPFADARPDVLSTLRTAAPWQTVRRKASGLARWTPGEKLLIRTDDFRYQKLRQRTESVAIFAVDASGSTALERLAEAKGAIELLLSDCYVRRDAVALIAFRGGKAELILEPTRSLVRAKRALSGLPAGGPTPLPHAMMQAAELANQVKRKGQTPLVIFLTDGKANIALDGSPSRATAQTDTKTIARQIAALSINTVVIDIARRPREAGRQLAAAMHGDYCLLPFADAKAVSNIVGEYLAAK